MRAFIAVAAMLSVVATVAARSGSARTTAQTCGLSIAIQDPEIRATFVRFERNQSAGAVRACANLRNDVALAQAGR